MHLNGPDLEPVAAQGQHVTTGERPNKTTHSRANTPIPTSAPSHNPFDWTNLAVSPLEKICCRYLPPPNQHKQKHFPARYGGEGEGESSPGDGASQRLTMRALLRSYPARDSSNRTDFVRGPDLSHLEHFHLRYIVDSAVMEPGLGVLW